MWTQAGLPFVDGLGPHDPGVRDVPDTRRCDGVQGPARLLPACLKGTGDCLSGLHTGKSGKSTLQSMTDGNKQVHRIYIVPGLGAAFLSSVAAPISAGRYLASCCCKQSIWRTTHDYYMGSLNPYDLIA